MTRRLFALAWLAAAGCGPALGGPTDAGSPADAGGSASDAGVDAGAGYAICPPGLSARFSSINAGLFQVSCGTGTGSCHSSAGAIYSGGLDLQANAHAALVGVAANNISGSQSGLLRVKPGDPGGSFLALKLATPSGSDPRYGSGMPFGAPGSVCPQTRAVIDAWIDAGALDN